MTSTVENQVMINVTENGEGVEITGKSLRQSFSLRQSMTFTSLKESVEARLAAEIKQQENDASAKTDYGDDTIGTISSSTPGEIDFSTRDLTSILSVRMICGFLSSEELGNASNFYRFDQCRFQEEGLVILSEALSKKQHITGMSFSWNHLTDDQMKILATMVGKLINLKTFYADGNSCTAHGMLSIIYHLGSLPELHFLQINDNNIGPETCEYLSNHLLNKKKLITLNIKNNQIGPIGLQNLEIVLSSKQCILKYLDISYNKINNTGANYIYEILKCCRTLTHLNIEGIHIVANGLIENEILIHLNLSSNSCGKIGARTLADALKENNTLEELLLSRSHTNQTAIGEEGGMALSEMLTINKTLKKLDIYWGNIGSSGGEALAKALGVNTCLTNINVAGNFVGSGAMIMIQDAITAHQNTNKKKIIRTGITDLSVYPNRASQAGPEGVAGATEADTNGSLALAQRRKKSIAEILRKQSLNESGMGSSADEVAKSKEWIRSRMAEMMKHPSATDRDKVYVDNTEDIGSLTSNKLRAREGLNSPTKARSTTVSPLTSPSLRAKRPGANIGTEYTPAVTAASIAAAALAESSVKTSQRDSVHRNRQSTTSSNRNSLSDSNTRVSINNPKSYTRNSITSKRKSVSKPA